MHRINLDISAHVLLKQKNAALIIVRRLAEFILSIDQAY